MFFIDFNIYSHKEINLLKHCKHFDEQTDEQFKNPFQIFYPTNLIQLISSETLIIIIEHNILVPIICERIYYKCLYKYKEINYYKYEHMEAKSNKLSPLLFILETLIIRANTRYLDFRDPKHGCVISIT